MKKQIEYLGQYADVLLVGLPDITEVGRLAPMYSDSDLVQQVQELSDIVLPIILDLWFPTHHYDERRRIFSAIVHQAVEHVIERRYAQRDAVRKNMEAGGQ